MSSLGREIPTNNKTNMTLCFRPQLPWYDQIDPPCSGSGCGFSSAASVACHRSTSCSHQERTHRYWLLRLGGKIAWKAIMNGVMRKHRHHCQKSNKYKNKIGPCYYKHVLKDDWLSAEPPIISLYVFQLILIATFFFYNTHQINCSTRTCTRSKNQPIRKSGDKYLHAG